MHNSAICHNKEDKHGKTSTIDSFTNYVSSFSSIVLPNAEILLENPLNKQENRVTALFDQGSQGTCVAQRHFEAGADTY